MADQEPLEASQSNGEGEGASTTPAAEQLPERIRVHALAKLLGTTSKRILAHLTEMGAQARSPQSSLDRAVAETVRDAFGPRDIDAPDPIAVPEPAEEPVAPGPIAESTVDAAIAAQDDRAADEIAAEEVEAAEAAVAAPARQTSLFASPFQSEPQVDEPVQYQPSAAVAAPLFQAPDAAAAEEARRARRAERKARTEERVAAEKDVETKAVTAKAVAEEPVAEDAEDEGEWDGEQRGRDEADREGTSRRRRRGRRGRGRGRGEQHGDNDTDDLDGDEAEADETAEAADIDAAEDEDEGAAVPEGSSSRRRRRRRRRKGGEDNEPEASDDDPPNTVVHEREPRSKRRAAAKDVDEVQGISGSTRLEAKRQRRRDGREAGRRRPPILTESEFLARREAVDRVMVVREKHFAEHPTSTTQVAVLEDNILVEHFVTSTGSASMVGNVYLGKVQNVLPSMEAAFVDIGRGRNGVLYAGEVNWEAAGLGGKERKIEQALKPGDTVLVQVSKDPVGHKGARLTTQISLAGRFLVYVPGGTSTGISRKLPDTERKRLKEILRDIVPQDAGVIIRTASEGVSEPELARDVERLQATWRTIEEQSKQGSGAPKTLYEEPDLLVKVVRDLFNEDFSKLVIEGERAWTTVENYVRTVAPDMLARVERYEGSGVDVFGSLRIDEQLAKALDRKVWLPSGGTLVIDRTEAMTVIDVNTGKFTGSGGSNLEETVTRNNLEAAEEIVRQMRLRDIGGMIVVDFIDMVLESNRDLVLRRLTEALGRDRTRHQVSEVTSLGLVQMTRKKLGTGLVEAFSTTCETCHGRGILVHNYPVEASAPAGDTGEGVGRREGSRRRRKDRNAPAAEAPAVEPVVEEKVEKTDKPEVKAEQAAAKRAHPVAMAMAAHAAEEAVHAADEDAVTAADAANAVPAEGDSVADVAAAESVIVRAAENAAAEATLAERAVTEVEDEVAASTNGTAVAPVVDTVVVESEPAAIESPIAEAHAAEAAVAAAEARSGRRPTRRRVARTASAPAADSKGAVFVLSSTDQADKPGFNLEDLAPAVVPPRARPRRRAAGRAAGAPEGEN
ncbi:translation initiation factor IF-2 N-terminal domain-containing protein [Nocardia seriolae]|uniref:translation initiation factor IF-2 N-terminal domain-containing protein n=2 Tax=Nocardia seriolae TaxID=37332 RepID=UPI0004BC0CFA|nr:ribonuclease E [Nocardia seriolae]BEK86064.1 translation initiation factor IF-2 N-terminal domain-containing protein [Nocardia seriolae]BEK98002.1 translation initiation factor IF-2 N-terminal domain-containing protein [Nocardia seriolae]GEM23169.1 putative ribonuclease E Rne [Nocardia seriolae NBRC 15557]